MSLPKENLDDKTFEELVKEAVSHIPVYTPDWTDYNVHDPGIMLIELFAWLAEMQIYRLNRIRDSSYRKFLTLMGIPKLKPARAAEVDVTFSLRNQQPTTVKAGTQVAAKDPVSGTDMIFETEQDLEVVPTNLQQIRSWREGKFIDDTEANGNENVFYYAFGKWPRTGDSLYLGFDRSLGDEETTLAFYLYEEEALEEKHEVLPSSTLSWDYCKGGDWRKAESWVRLDATKKEIRDDTLHLSKSGKVRIKVTGAMERVMLKGSNLFWLRSTILEAGYEIPPKIDNILLNTVSAIQSRKLKNCTFSGSGLPDLYLDLEHTPVIDNTLSVTVRVKEDTGTEWREVEDFDASKPGDMHYTVDLATGRVSFGDGINGKIPPKGEDNITISYRSGGGVRGNVGPHAIDTVLDIVTEDVTVDNMKTAVGGEEAENLEDSLIRARKDLRTVNRAVTSADYEYLAMNTPGLKVARAKAIPRYHPSQDIEVPGIVTVIVVPLSPYAKPMPSTNFLKTVYMHLDKYRILTTELFLIPPEYIEVSVGATVILKPKYRKETVEENVRTELETFLHPIRGGIDRNGWTFGRPVYISELYEVIDGVKGVDYVETVTLKKNGKKHAGDIHIPAHGLVYSRTHIIEAKEEKEDFYG